VRIGKRALVACLLFALAFGTVPPPSAMAQPLPPGLREATAFFNLIGSLNRRNRVYTEARRTQSDVDAHYDELRRALAENLVEGELTTAPSQKPIRSFIRMTQALSEERDAATAQIEAEKNDARRRFNREVGANLFDLLVRSSGGKRLVADIQSNVNGLREAVEFVQSAADGATLDAALQSLANRITSSEQIGNLVKNLGGLLAQEINERINGLISKIDGVSAGTSREMDEVLGLLADFDRRLNEIAGTTHRVPISIAGDGSPLSDIRTVQEADAALNVAIDSILRYGIIVGGLTGMSDADRTTMRDRIRQSLLTTRLADLSHATRLAENVWCEHVEQGRYAEVAGELGMAPEVPREGSEVRYLVCYTMGTREPILAALIGPSQSDANTSETTEVEGDPPPPNDEDAAFAPIEIHVDVEDADAEPSDGRVSSFFQLWPEPKTEHERPLATPRLTGGTLDIAFDFDEMTVSGFLDFAYERDGSEETLCTGSPESFSGTARGAFEGLAIQEAITSETPPSDWGLPAEDWWPMEPDGWYVGGSFPVELAMSGVAVMGCATLYDTITYDETPFDETAVITSWMMMTIDLHRDQGSDHKTVAFVNLHSTTNESFDVKPFWTHSFGWSHIIERAIPDPPG